MPRIARKDIKTPFLHVMVQGVNKEAIFNNKLYLNYYLKSIKSESHYKEFDLIAYCMMNNHAHLLFYVKDIECFGKFMKSVNQNFATFYNKNENRVGVVFRNRYQAEQIYDAQYLKNCIKYIHDNPVKARIVKNCKDYPYSSYHEFSKGIGCAKHEILKEAFGYNVDYLKEIENAQNRRFLDFDDYQNDKEYFDEGINCFKKEFNCSIFDILSERNVLFKLLDYLKKEFRFKYNETLEFLGISKGILKFLKYSKE